MGCSLQPSTDTSRTSRAPCRPDPGSLGEGQPLPHHLAPSETRDRDMFVAGLAHELRTPLAVLKGRLHALEDGVIDPASGECGRLLEQVDRLLRITDGLTTLAQAHGGRLFLDRRSVDLSRIVVHCFQEMRAEAPASTIDLQGSDEPIIVACDPARMSQALNALARFSLLRVPSGSSLVVNLSSLPDRFILTVHCADWAITSQEARSAASAFLGVGDGEIASLSHESIDFALAEALIAIHGGRLCVNAGSSVHDSTIIIEMSRTVCPAASE